MLKSVINHLKTIFGDIEASRGHIKRGLNGGFGGDICMEPERCLINHIIAL